MEIINTDKNDLEFIYWLFEQAIVYQKKNNYPVWKEYDKGVLNNDIEEKLQYKILIDGKLACIFSVCYSDIFVWREREVGDAIYLHRIIVNPNFKGRKLVGNIIPFVRDLIKNKNIKYIRMDTWGDNPILMEYYQSFGFKIIDYYTTPDIKELPVQQRGNYVVLLQLEI